MHIHKDMQQQKTKKLHYQGGFPLAHSD